MTDDLKMRVHGDASMPTLVYLPGMHGDWTLVSSFRAAIDGRVRFVEFTYPRTTTWSLDDYAAGIEEMLVAQGIHRGWLLGESFGSQPAWQIVKRFLDRQDAPYAPGPIPDPSVEERPCPDALGLLSTNEGSQHAAALGQFPSPPSRRAIAPLRRDGGGEGSGVGLSGNQDRGLVAFQPQGLILAGGFVRHPVIWAVRMAGRVSSAIPMWFVKLFCVLYARYAKFRHKRAPETLASIGEFVANRTMEADRQAIVRRYKLIAENDLRPVARQSPLPVYYLAGLVDPLVPWCYVRWWLRRNCPDYRGGKTMWRADHNVLGTAPGASAELIWQWMNAADAPKGIRMQAKELGASQPK
jgi:pimeloyl-ACP methyl ester carboxylesterase